MVNHILQHTLDKIQPISHKHYYNYMNQNYQHMALLQKKVQLYAQVELLPRRKKTVRSNVKKTLEIHEHLLEFEIQH